MHDCPGPDCKRRVKNEMLACRAHWFKVSKPTRDRVWAAYHAGSDDYVAAVAAAVEEMHADA